RRGARGTGRGGGAARDPVAVVAFAFTAIVIISAAFLVRGPQLSPTEQLPSTGEQPVVEFNPPVAALGAAVRLPTVEATTPSTTTAPTPPRILVLGSER